MHNLIFFGSASFSTIVLQKLIDSKINIVPVVTTPNKPAGRHLKLTPNPVKLLAQKHNIPVVESLHDSSFITSLPAGKVPNSIGLVAAYGHIIKPEILSKFNGQLYNIHPSLLPKYRGPSPLQNQILDGISETGVTIIQIDELMDHGPIIAQQKDAILDTDTTESLGTRLFTLGTDLFIKTAKTGFFAEAQNDNEATYTKLLTRQDGFLPYEDFIKFDYDSKFRAYHPWPGIWSTTPEGKRIKLVALKPETLIQIEGQKSTLWQS